MVKFTVQESTLDEEPRACMLKKFLGDEVREMKCCKRKRKYMEGKGRGIWGSTLEEGPRAGMLKRILGRKLRDNTGSAGRKESNHYCTRMWSKAQAKKNCWQGNRKNKSS